MTGEVAHPDHYTRGRIECIDAIEAATVDKTGIEAVCTANILKYVWRYTAKGRPIQDLRKAQWYLDRLIAAVDERANQHNPQQELFK